MPLSAVHELYTNSVTVSIDFTGSWAKNLIITKPKQSFHSHGYYSFRVTFFSFFTVPETVCSACWLAEICRANESSHISISPRRNFETIQHLRLSPWNVLLSLTLWFWRLQKTLPNCAISSKKAIIKFSSSFFPLCNNWFRKCWLLILNHNFKFKKKLQIIFFYRNNETQQILVSLWQILHICDFQQRFPSASFNVFWIEKNIQWT